jgi:hypothetical protein
MFGFFRKEKEMLRESLRLQREALHRLEEVERIQWRIEDEIVHLKPRLSFVQIAFTAPSTKGENLMSVQGPVTLTSAGQVTIASINGFDQFGNAWTGTIPPVTFTIDNSAFATSVPNADGITDTVTAVANGVANLTASLTTAEGIALTDVEAVTVNIPVVPPPVPVLSSIKIAFA